MEGVITYSLLSPVHTSDNVAKNGDIVAEIGDNVANSPVHTSDNVSETGNIVYLATMSPVSATM